MRNIYGMMRYGKRINMRYRTLLGSSASIWQMPSLHIPSLVGDLCSSATAVGFRPSRFSIERSKRSSMSAYFFICNHYNTDVNFRQVSGLASEDDRPGVMQCTRFVPVPLRLRFSSGLGYPNRSKRRIVGGAEASPHVLPVRPRKPE